MWVGVGGTTKKLCLVIHMNLYCFIVFIAVTDGEKTNNSLPQKPSLVSFMTVKFRSSIQNPSVTMSFPRTASLIIVLCLWLMDAYLNIYSFRIVFCWYGWTNLVKELHISSDCERIKKSSKQPHTGKKLSFELKSHGRVISIFSAHCIYRI